MRNMLKWDSTQVNAWSWTNSWTQTKRRPALWGRDPLLSIWSWGHTPDWETESFTSLCWITCKTLLPPFTFLFPYFADTFIPSYIYPSLCCSPFLSNSSIPLCPLSFLPFFLNLLPQSPFAFLSHYASSSTNLSLLSLFLKTQHAPGMALSGRGGVFFYPWLVRKGIFLCFQLHAKRPSGKSICQHAHQDLMGAACAWGMRLHSMTPDYPV